MIKLDRLKEPLGLMEWSRTIIFKLNDYFATRSEIRKYTTLKISGSVTTTTVSDSLIADVSQVILIPADANAKGKGWYFDQTETTPTSKFVLHHDTISLTATFKYLIVT